MTFPAFLQGSELIDSARANGKKGIAIAAQRCGYGDDLTKFEQELKRAGEAIGIEIQSFDDLIHAPQKDEEPGIEIAPEASGRL